MCESITELKRWFRFMGHNDSTDLFLPRAIYKMFDKSWNSHSESNWTRASSRPSQYIMLQRINLRKRPGRPRNVASLTNSDYVSTWYSLPPVGGFSEHQTCCLLGAIIMTSTIKENPCQQHSQGEAIMTEAEMEDIEALHYQPNKALRAFTSYYTSNLQEVSRMISAPEKPTELPIEVCSLIAEFCPAYPLTFEKDSHCQHCQVSDQRCKSGRWCPCVIIARSRQPFAPLKFFNIRFVGNSIGIGLTLNPNGSSGVRRNPESCGFFLETKCFHYGTNEETGEDRAIGIHDWFLKSQYYNTGNIIGLAVDYEKNELLLKWPNRIEILRLSLPKQFRNRLLFPFVQCWDGSEVAVDYTEEKTGALETAADVQKTTVIDVGEEDTSSSTLSSLSGGSNSEEIRWYSGWLSVCRSRGIRDELSIRAAPRVRHTTYSDYKDRCSNRIRYPTLSKTSGWCSTFVRTMMIDELGPIEVPLDDFFVQSERERRNITAYWNRRGNRGNAAQLSCYAVQRY
eukprot:scaffold24404_cov103-Cylindrotheca_fusiformis.AAC.3